MQNYIDYINYCNCEFTLYTRKSLYFLFFLSLILAFGLFWAISSKRRYEDKYEALSGEMTYLEKEVKDFRSKGQNQSASEEKETEKEILSRIEKLLEKNCNKEKEE